MSDQRTKRQHYVPRFYLENFTDRDGMVWAYDTKKGSVRSDVPEATAIETNFYSLLNDDGTYEDTLEKTLSDVESAAAALYPRVLKGDRLTGSDRSFFAIFVATLYLRSPSMVHAGARLLGSMAGEVARRIVGDRKAFEKSIDAFDADRGTITSEDARAEMFETVNDGKSLVLAIDKHVGLTALAASESLSKILERMSWITVDTGRQSLITSDSPVTRTAPAEKIHPFYGDGGFVAPHIWVSLPLSPSRAIEMSWSRDVGDGPYVADRDRARRYNRIRAGFADRYLFSSVRDDGIRKLGEKHTGDGAKVDGMPQVFPIELRRKL